MKRRQQGSVTIEYAVSILPFFVMLLAIIEVCRFMMVSSMIDVALVSETRQIRVESQLENLSGKLELALKEQNYPLLDSALITVQPRYFKSLTALRDNTYSSSYNQQPFAEFTLLYPYKALFIADLSESFGRLIGFKRTILVTLEKSANYVP